MNNEHTFLQKLERITLGTASSTRQRKALALYADQNPVVSAAVAPTFLSLFMSSSRFPLYATLTAVVIFGGGGSTLAAESTVPGDVFYGIKIHVNEPLMSAFATSPEGQARLSATLAARRVDEVVTLAASGRLTPDKQQYLEDAFAKEVQNTKTHTQTLSASGDTVAANAVTADFNANLAGEAQALGAIQAPTPEKTKVFLRKVLTLSEGDDRGPQQDEDTSKINFSKRPSRVSGGVSVAAVAQTATSSPRTDGAGRGARRAAATSLSKNILITASTTLDRVFESASSEIVPKTDRAIQKQEKEDGLLKGSTESFDLGH